MEFRQLTRNCYWSVAQQISHVGNRCAYTVRRFKKYDRAQVRLEVLKPMFSVFRPRRREAREDKLVGWIAAGCEGCEDRARSGNGDHARTLADRGGDKTLTRVGHERRASIRYKRDVGACRKFLQQRRQLFGFVVLVEAGCGRRDSEMTKQLSGSARVFCGDQADSFQRV